MSLLRVDNLHLWRGDAHVLRGVSFEVAAGMCLQVTGANGAGKTTLLRALCGLVPPEEGRVRWRGKDIDQDRYAFCAELCFLGHDNGLKGDLSAHENLRYSVGLRRPCSAAAIDAALLRSGIAGGDTAFVRQLSAGQRRRVALARLMLSDCALWVLDEPTAHLDARGQQMVQKELSSHLQAGGIAVVATHQPLGLDHTRVQTLALP